MNHHECENGHCTGHLEKYQDPDALDRREVRGETAVHKAARNDDVNKLELLDLACANLDFQVSWLRGVRGAQRLASALRTGVNGLAVNLRVVHEHCYSTCCYLLV